ncbi:amino acid ABC transporter substrate-binding protein [Methanobrevibacter sp.]|uniref:amino acid ABC transporter substrate-binding protein n=1 Tax=Methanobrevibacter sp. TaxID=66852 RepID=UPI003866C47F
MNKKIILVFTLVLAAFLMMSAVSAEGFFGFLDDGSSESSNNETTFVVGFAEFPPFGYKDANGKYIGFDLDLAKEVAKRNNWTFKAQPIIDWESKEVELNANEIDCIWSEFTIDGREDHYTWSNPYFNNSQVIVVKSNSGIDSSNDLKGKVVEVQSESSAYNAIQNNKTLNDSIAKINQVGDYDTALMDLGSGVCDAVVMDYPSANYRITERFNDHGFKILDEHVAHEKYGVAFKKGNDELRDKVQKTLDEMFKDGTVDRIAQNYTNYGIHEQLLHP